MKEEAVKAGDKSANKISVCRKKDIFGQSISKAYAHAKYVHAAQVAPLGGKRVKVRSYLISHSLPRFPNFTINPVDKSQQLPNDPKQVFSDNFFKSSAKGQHFFCQSFENEETLDDQGQLEYIQGRLSRYLEEERHLVAVYHLFRTIRVGVILSNYHQNMHLKPMKIYHKLFDPRVAWSPVRNLAPNGLVNNDYRLFPIGPTKSAFRQVACTAWMLGGTQDPACIRSYKFTTTNLQYQLKFHAFAKHGNAYLDVYDDLLAAQVVPKEFYEKPKDPNFETKYLVDIILVQHWIDHAALGNRKRTMIGDGMAVKHNAYIFSTTSLRYPLHPDDAKVKGSNHIRVPSLATNHAKVFVTVPIHGSGTRVLGAGFSDLNRTYLQRGREAKNKPGRGGAIWYAKNGILGALMLSLHPDITDIDGIPNVPPSLLMKHLPASPPDLPAVLKYEQHAQVHSKVELAIPSRIHDNSFFVCAYRHPFINVTPVDKPAYWPMRNGMPVNLYSLEGGHQSQHLVGHQKSSKPTLRKTKKVLTFDSEESDSESPMPSDSSATSSNSLLSTPSDSGPVDVASDLSLDSSGGEESSEEKSDREESASGCDESMVIVADSDNAGASEDGDDSEDRHRSNNGDDSEDGDESEDRGGSEGGDDSEDESGDGSEDESEEESEKEMLEEPEEEMLEESEEEKLEEESEEDSEDKSMEGSEVESNEEEEESSDNLGAHPSYDSIMIVKKLKNPKAPLQGKASSCNKAKSLKRARSQIIDDEDSDDEGDGNGDGKVSNPVKPPAKAARTTLMNTSPGMPFGSPVRQVPTSPRRRTPPVSPAHFKEFPKPSQHILGEPEHYPAAVGDGPPELPQSMVDLLKGALDPGQWTHISELVEKYLVEKIQIQKRLSLAV